MNCELREIAYSVQRTAYSVQRTEEIAYRVQSAMADAKNARKSSDAGAEINGSITFLAFFHYFCIINISFVFIKAGE